MSNTPSPSIGTKIYIKVGYEWCKAKVVADNLAQLNLFTPYPWYRIDLACHEWRIQP